MLPANDSGAEKARREDGDVNAVADTDRVVNASYSYTAVLADHPYAVDSAL